MIILILLFVILSVNSRLAGMAKLIKILKNVTLPKLEFVNKAAKSSAHAVMEFSIHLMRTYSNFIFIEYLIQ